MNDNQSTDFYTMKVFLYKYTPEFRRVTDTATTPIQERTVGSDGSITVNGKDIRNTRRLSKIERYEFDLDEEKYFSMFDISEFVSSYNFSQDLSQNTFNWTVTLQNTVIPFSKLKSIKVVGPDINSSLLQRLAMYETQASELVDLNFVKEAKSRRGRTEQPLQARSPLPRDSFGSDASKSLANRFGYAQKKVGLQLFDLVQPYDIISVFIYRDTKPVDGRVGVPEPFSLSEDGVFRQIRIFRPNPSGSPLRNFLRDEQILLSPDLESKSIKKTLFNNELNGFVLSKTLSVTAGDVDTVTVAGNGITRLFGATRRLLKESTLQNDIYATNEIDSPIEYNAFENVYSDKSVQEIFLDLFNIVYKIKPSSLRRFLSRTRIENNQEVSVDSGATREDVAFPNSSFYDITTMKVANILNVSSFVIPPFLLSIVMKRRGFKVREPSNDSQLNSLVQNVQSEGRKPKRIVSQAFKFGSTNQQLSQAEDAKTSEDDFLSLPTVDELINEQDSSQSRTGIRSPIFFSSELNKLQAFFRFFGRVLTDFDAQLKTPFQIIDEIKANTFLEFFERPDGIITIRPPEYNDRENVVKSSTIDVISASYNENISNIMSRQRVGYAIDGLPSVSPLEAFFFTNGKLLKQFGHMEASAEANPNAEDEKKNDTLITQSKRPGMFKYAEYLLRLHNASLKTATITAAYDQRILVGRTYFDERNQKFGYISNVSKTTVAGGTVNVTFNLTYVRDAYIDNDGNIQVEQLDRLVDLVQEFDIKNDIPNKNEIDPEPDVRFVDTGLKTTKPAQPNQRTTEEIDDNDVTV